MTQVKNQDGIQDAEFVEVPNLPDNIIHEIEIELSEKFLEKNPTIKSIYENGKLKVSLSPNIDGEFSDTITKLIPQLQSSELLIFNPFLDAINTLASYDYYIGVAKPIRTPEMDDKAYDVLVKKWIKEEDQRYKEVSNAIRTFNGTLTKSQNAMKKPIKDAYDEKIAKIKNLYEALKGFSDKRRDTVSTNFKELLDTQESIKIAKAEAVTAKANEQVKTLQEQNNEANLKIQRLSGVNAYADLVTEISEYFLAAQESISKLNVPGLIELKEEVTNKVFDVSSQGAAEQMKLESTAKMSRTGTIALIDEAILGIQNGTSVAQSQDFTQSAPISSPPPANAQVAETLYGGSEVVSNSESPMFNTNVTNDAENFADIIRRFNSMKGEIMAMKPFDDHRLAKTNSTLAQQKKGLMENIDKLISFVAKKQALYNQNN